MSGKSADDEPLLRHGGVLSYLDPGILKLLIAILVFSSQNSFFVLISRGDPNLFTPCNLLCSSSVFGAIFMIVYNVFYIKSVDMTSFGGISRFEWLMLIFGSILYSVAGPFLFLTGLATISVPFSAIIQRLESINFIILSKLFMEAKPTSYTLASAISTLIGVLMSMLWDTFFGNPFPTAIGMLYIILAGYCYSGSLLISKKFLSGINTGVVGLVRVLLGVVLFHILNVSMGNQDDLSHSELWLIGLPYGFVYLFLGQTAWIDCLTTVEPFIIAVSTNLLFLLSLTWSAVVIQIYPNSAQWVASAFILLGVFISIYEEYQKFISASSAKKDHDSAELSLQRV